MKRLLLIIGLLAAASIGYGQTPYKIQNPYLHQVWMGDTNKTYIYPDSIVYFGNSPVWWAYDSTYITEFGAGLGDTNILFVDQNTGRLRITTPSAIAGSAASKWEYSGLSTLNPIDTTKDVAIGTNDADGYDFRVDGTMLLDDGVWQYRSGNFGGYPFNGFYRRTAGRQTYLNGLLDATSVGAGLKLVMGWVYDTTFLDYTHRRMLINIDTLQGINIYASGGGYMPNEGIHISTPMLTGLSVIESDMNFDTNRITIARRNFDSGSNMLAYVLQLADSNFIYFRSHRDGTKSNIFEFDTTGALTLNGAYTFPLADGNAGEVLTTDGSGNVSWQPGGSTGVWDTNGTVVHTLDSLWKVAIGTTKLAGTEKFRVLNGAVLFDGTTGSTPVSGAGERFMWIPDKLAFRAGDVTSTQWDAANIGTGSMATGRNCIASGNFSGAIGELCQSTGISSFTTGATCTAGSYATAHGYTSDASGSASFAAGSDADATAYGTTATGYGTRATAQSAFAIGESGAASGTAAGAVNYYTIASGYNSFAANDQTTAGAYDMTAFGRFNVTGGTASSWVSTDRLFVIGNGTGTGANSNDAVTVYKDGKFNAGDASSTTDAVLQVTPADSVVKSLGKFVEYKPDHAYFTYKDATGYAVPIVTASTWTDLTDSTAVKLTDKESTGFTFDNDTMVYNGYGDAHIRFEVIITAQGGSAEDWELRVYNITDGAEVDISQICTTNGAGNYISMPFLGYDMAADPGDRYIVQIRNLTNNDDPTIYRVWWWANVVHYK